MENNKLEKKSEDNQFKKESLYRESLYRNKINEVSKDNINDKNKIEEDEKETFLTEKSDIHNIIEEFINEKIMFRIEHSNQELFNNVMISIEDNILTISNPFSTYANRVFPKKIKCFVIANGNEYNFILSNLKETKGNANINCTIPDSVRIISRIKFVKVDDYANRVVGFFLEVKNKEIIGSINEISLNGISFSIPEDTIDDDDLILMKANKTSIIPLILENNKQYKTFIIKVLSTKEIKYNKSIQINATFDLLNDEDLEIIKSIFENVKNEYIDFKNKERTESVIKCSKMDLSI